MAPGAFHVMTVVCPFCILDWPAVMPGGILGLTVIVRVDVTDVPELPLAVNVYVVVEAGVIEVLPVDATVPMPGTMFTLLVLIVFQVNIAVSPASIVCLLTLKELITGEAAGAGMITGKSGG